MKKQLVYLVLAASLALGASGCLPNSEAAENGDDAPAVVTVQPVEAFGVVTAQEIRNVLLDFPATVVDVHVREGENVKQDTVLMSLDLSEYRAQIEQKGRELKIARWELERISGSTSRKMQREKIASLEQELSMMEEKSEKSYFSENTLIADFSDGVVYDLGYRPGDMVIPGGKLFSVLMLDELRVEANIFEEFIKDVAVGANVSIIPVADKSREYRGEVTAISAKAVRQNGDTVVPVQITVFDNDGFLLPNFNVDVFIER